MKTQYYMPCMHTHLLLERPELGVQRGDQLQHHGAGHRRVAGSQEDLLRGPGVRRQSLGVVVAGQEQPARGRGVQSGNDVSEGDLTAGRRGLEGVQVHGPASGQRRQGGGDVLQPGKRGGGSEVKIRDNR